MTRPRHALFPRIQRRADALGERLRLARLRRRMPLAEMAARIGADRKTVGRLEKGDLAVSLALLVRALVVLGLEADLDKIAHDDALGARLQDLELPRRPRRATVRQAKPAADA